jgi:GMP synthase (glutamine-hydrolysing)
MHRDQVASVPAGLVCLGSSPKCPVQGLYKPGCVFTLQAHPEFDAFIMREILRTRHEQGVFDDEMFAEGMARADGAHDGGLVAAKIWEFLGV